MVRTMTLCGVLAGPTANLDQRLGMVTVLDGWARDGVYPAAAAVEEAFGDENGYEPNYQPAAWPAEPDA